MSIGVSDLAYPVMVLNDKGHIEVREDEDIMTTATSYELRSGWFNSMTIVDSNGLTVKVREVRAVCGKGKYWGYYSPLFDRIVRTEVVLEDPISKTDVEELRANVIRLQRKAGRSAEASHCARMLKEIRAAKSTRQLIESCQPQMSAKRFYETLKPSLSGLRTH